MVKKDKLIKYSKYMNENLSYIGDMLSFCFEEGDGIDEYRKFQLLNLDDTFKDISVLNIPNYINKKFSSVFGDYDNFFDFDNKSYIFNKNNSKYSIVFNSNVLLHKCSDKYISIIEGTKIKDNNYNAIFTTIDFNNTYTIKHNTKNNNLYLDNSVNIGTNKYTIYNTDVGSKVPKYELKGCVLSLPNGLLFSSIDTGYNILKNDLVLEINSSNYIKVNCLDTISLNSNNVNINSKNINLKSKLMITTSGDIVLDLNGTKGKLKINDTTFSSGDKLDVYFEVI